MTAITCHPSDPGKNLHRYCRLDVQPDLFGAWFFIREWGRDGRSGQVRQIIISMIKYDERAQEGYQRAQEDHLWLKSRG